jgi:hypothetical protein
LTQEGNTNGLPIFRSLTRNQLIRFPGFWVFGEFFETELSVVIISQSWDRRGPRMKFERLIEFTPAWDRRDSNPKKDYGIGDVEIRFFVIFDRRAIQFSIGTHWYLPQTVERIYNNTFDHFMCGARPRDIAYHSPIAMEEGQDPVGAVEIDTEHPTVIDDHVIAPFSFLKTNKFTQCRFTKGRCFMGCSFSRGRTALATLIEKGSDELWEFLEAEFVSTFEKFFDDLFREKDGNH